MRTFLIEELDSHGIPLPKKQYRYNRYNRYLYGNGGTDMIIQAGESISDTDELVELLSTWHNLKEGLRTAAKWGYVDSKTGEIVPPVASSQSEV